MPVAHPFRHSWRRRSLLERSQHYSKHSNKLDSVLQRQFNQGGIDSLSVAIVSSEGSLYEGFLGKRRVNESDAAVEVP